MKQESQLVTYAAGHVKSTVDYYRAMHYSAKCGLAIVCRFFVRLSVRHDHIDWKSWKHTHTHTTVLLLFWIMSRTTRVSRYQKGKTRKVRTNLDLLENYHHFSSILTFHCYQWGLDGMYHTPPTPNACTVPFSSETNQFPVSTRSLSKAKVMST